MRYGWACVLVAFIGCGEDNTTGTPGDTAVDSDATSIFEVLDIDTGVPETDTALPETDTSEQETIVFDTGSPDTSTIDVTPEVLQPGEFGAPCVANNNCNSGYCVEGPEGYVCTRLCSETCPPEWDCKGVAGESDVTFLCIPRTDKLCAPCRDDLQCNGGSCMAIEGELRCATACQGPDDCPSGFGCEAGDDGQRCVPQTGSCTCYSDFDGGLRTCRNENGFGTCYGIETCDQASGWGACDAKTPAVEVCNGQDDDCDAFLDEDIAQVGGACEVSVGGVGSCDGVTICAGAGGLQCQGPTPTPETCDFEDDDCDGQVDEDFKTGNAYARFEHCGTCGRSCAVGFPNAAQTTCQVDQGVAQCVVVSCDPGYIKQNDFQCIPDIVNLCEPCSENANCLGQGSACVSLSDGDFCAKACSDDPTRGCPVGFSCQTVAGVADKQCLPTTGVCSCGPATLGLSRACSVTVSPDGQPSTTCAGTETCGGAGWGACALPSETCNSFDDDCDGTVDDGFKNAQGKYDRVANCGSCGISCLALTFANADPICDASGSGAPQCGFQCKAGFVDVDGLPGCECKPTSTTDLPDPDGIDANCDGIDGELGKSVFVAKTGDDTGLGTIDDPLRTLQAGIAKAAAQSKRDVLVATGVYVESIALANKVNVYGGYSPDFGQRDRFTHESAILGVDPSDALRGAVNAQAIANGAANAVVFDGFSVFGADNANPGGNSYAIYLREVGPNLTVSNNVIVAGNGGNGSAGAKGADGARGIDGVGGTAALWTTAVSECVASDEAPGGAAGVRQCGGVDVSGGRGGKRVCPVTTAPILTSPQTHGVEEYGADGYHGGPTGGLGGEPGWHQRVAAAPTCSPTGAPNGHNSFGFDGGVGDPGDDGTAAAPCNVTSGSIDGFGQWVGAAPGVAGDAGHGAGGGGGGAGGGVDVHDCSYRVPVGGSGGGGGSGGCGGMRGQGGTSGGGSFAIFLAYGAAPSGLPVITGNEIVRGRGGAGGPGGAGGVGGPEGLGGQGGPSRRGEEPGQSYPFNCCVSAGGDGGPGGPGGHGAGGGGGCGGPAYGIYVAPAALGLPRTSLNGNTLPTSGAGGVAGAGGTSLGNAGPAGSTGTNAATNY